ncbi:MAG: bifunctional glutamate N-acetyltransferase/amino-acid acetyltransferase ArgJ [Elusimicrobiota bacterium]
MITQSLPLSFRAIGAVCGISSRKNKKDIALIYSEKPCVSAGLFTTNLVKAAPVLVSEANIKNNIRAVLVNSGCANACTGKDGLNDAKYSIRILGRSLGIKPENILIASTGVIGARLPMINIEKGINILVKNIFRKSDDNGLSFAKAIMTTDTTHKTTVRKITIGGKTVTIWGAVKGSGMIHPNMATMLGFILTDAGISKNLLTKALRDSGKISFNSITVDGDTSTNDCVFALANGAQGSPGINKIDGNYKKFYKAFEEVMLGLAKMIARDGEGATKFINILVKAKTENDAKKIANTIATSPLVKTACFGNDPNWGRIIAAAGRAGVVFNPEKTSLVINGVKIFDKGRGIKENSLKAKEVMKKKDINIALDTGSGKNTASVYTCDFSYDYIKINAEYHT